MRTISNCVAIVIALVALANSLRAADNFDWATVKPDAVLKAIAAFESDPGGTNTAGAMVIIANYAQASTNVSVTINEGYLPWFSKKPEIKNGQVLLMAFVAGNIRPQLEKRLKQDHPADGLLLMCKMYATLRKKNQIEPIPQVEEWSKLDRAGIRNLVPKIQRKDSQHDGAANGSQPVRSETNSTSSAAGSRR
jgi:hypothetical protein